MSRVSDFQNERKIHVSLIDLAAECVFWLSVQTHERPPSEIFNGITNSGRKQEEFSLKACTAFQRACLSA